MHPYKRTERGSQGDTRDFTKKRAYVWFDLSIRALSALGLLALGIAGWLFQVRVHEARDAEERRERQSRQYLPVLRSLTELELALDDAATVLTEHSIGKSQLQLFPDLSSRIDSAAIATLIIAKDPLISVELPVPRAAMTESMSRIIGVRSAAFMFGDMLRIVAIAQRTKHRDGAKPLTIGIQSLGTRWHVSVYQGSKGLAYIALKS